MTQWVAESEQRLRDSSESHAAALEPLRELTYASVSPLQRLQQALHPWVAFGIMPAFALANAGVAIEMSAIRHPVTLAIVLGLLLGKPIGILGVCWLGVKTGLARLPSGVTWPSMVIGGCLGGIGFTMSLFVANLAFDQANPSHDAMLLDAGKLGTLLGSTSSALAACVAAYFLLPKNPNQNRQAPG